MRILAYILFCGATLVNSSLSAQDKPFKCPKICYDCDPAHAVCYMKRPTELSNKIGELRLYGVHPDTAKKIIEILKEDSRK